MGVGDRGLYGSWLHYLFILAALKNSRKLSSRFTCSRAIIAMLHSFEIMLISSSPARPLGVLGMIESLP